MDSYEIDEKFLKISNELNIHNGLFTKFWQMGRPRFTDKIPTAAVGFNKQGGFVEFLFNPDFWSKLSIKELAFVVAHECLHVLLNHGKRLKGLYAHMGNVAADITINEMLTTSFGFDDKLPVITGENNLNKEGKPSLACLIKTVFSDEQQKVVQKGREFEYYYGLLKEKAVYVKCRIGKGGENEGMDSLDDHNQMPDFVPEELEDMIKQLSEEEKEAVAKNVKAGDGSSFTWIQAMLKPKPNKVWQQIIKEWTIKMYREKRKTQWKHTNRRFVLLQGKGGIVIPTEEFIDDKQANKIDIFFFMDVSGSCHGHSQTFFSVAKTIPKDKFIIEPYAFDTETIKINLEAKELPQGGGTSFHQLEELLQKQKKYPSAVFVLTDGMGSNVNPEFPDRWHIFLTEDYKECFPKNCHFYDFNSLLAGKRKSL